MRELEPSLRGRLFELSALLVDRLGVSDVGAAFEHRVAYHDLPLAPVTRGRAPLELLGRPRTRARPLAAAEECCGFGGTFAVKNADVSSAMLADKCDAIASSGADACTALDGSCLLQIGGGLSRRGSRVRALHLAEILAS